MLARSLGRVSGAALLALAALEACSSEPVQRGEAGSSCSFGHEQQAFTQKCFPQSLEPITDPASPSFGQVNCSVVEFAAAGSSFCDCSSPGYSPPSSDELVNAYATLTANGECHDECCGDVCFCDLAQLTGEELAACQGGDNERITVQKPGWCYVEPALGIGDPSTVRACPPDDGRLLLFTPIRGQHLDIVSCVTPASD